MIGIVRSAVLACGILLGAVAGAQAAEAPSVQDWEHDWIVVTMTRDGSWGVGSGRSTTLAIAEAIRRCKLMAGGPNDCGAEFVSLRNAWALGLHCSTHSILVTSDDQADAEAAARFAVTDLRLHHVPELPPCRTMLTVDPNGAVRGTTTLARAR
jgi:hypothetical protein